MPDLVCICTDVRDPWCDVHPFKPRTTPTRRNEPRPLDDPWEPICDGRYPIQGRKGCNGKDCGGKPHE